MIRFKWSANREGWNVNFTVIGGSEAFLDAALSEHGIEAVSQVGPGGELEVFPAFPDPLEPNERDDVLCRASDVIEADDKYALAAASAAGVAPAQRHAHWLALSPYERAFWRTDCDAYDLGIASELKG